MEDPTESTTRSGRKQNEEERSERYKGLGTNFEKKRETTVTGHIRRQDDGVHELRTITNGTKRERERGRERETERGKERNDQSPWCCRDL